MMELFSSIMEPDHVKIYILQSSWHWRTSALTCQGVLVKALDFIIVKANIQEHYMGGLSNATQPNFPFRKSLRTRNAAWWMSPLNKWIASFWTNLHLKEVGTDSIWIFLLEWKGDHTSWNKVLKCLNYIAHVVQNRCISTLQQPKLIIFGILGFPEWAVCISLSLAKCSSPPPNPNLPPAHNQKYFLGKTVYIYTRTHAHIYLKSKWEQR